MSGLGDQELIEPLGRGTYPHIRIGTQCLNSVSHLCGNEGTRRPVGITYFVLWQNVLLKI
jgi:hypothetical protein